MTKAQRIKRWQIIIDECVSAHTMIEDSLGPAIECGAIDINGKIHEGTWKAFEKMLEVVDSHGWISWFIYDNQKGKRGLTAGAGNIKEKPIKTTRDLARIMAEYEA